MESGLALSANAQSRNISEIVSQQTFHHCIWLTDNVESLTSELSSQLQVVVFPKIDSPDDSVLAAVVEAIQSIKIDEALVEQTAVFACSYNLLGVWFAYYLMENGAAPVHAVARVRAMFEQCFVEDGWDQFVFDVLYRLQA
ncbi:hypothetical protein JYB87_12360 [Shewanella avicenniae]|uniref:Uncharacterized protein n=1 Tax=Shewanella avicenniae TaxID=2814294 RepID=A0ABX7QM77_9GAMM|nr:hypothetical protein [Shewanella avicenniae]QSX32553.1 hypothetical protein JYB87_12360 [Shewanella avicenniae]